MMNDGRRKVAVVTGGTRGIGRAISMKLATAGVRVFAPYARDRAAADALEEEAKSRGYSITCLRGDLTKDRRTERLVEEIKDQVDGIDTIVHCAASGVHRRASELTIRHMSFTFDINVFAIHSLVSLVAPNMPRGGRIIGVTSHGGTRVIPFYAAVGASKGALESLFRHYAVEYAPRGVAVNLVCPGMVLTDAVEAFPEKEARIERAIQNTPTGRLTTASDVADLVYFLTTDAAAQIVGQTITIDGGKTLSV